MYAPKVLPDQPLATSLMSASSLHLKSVWLLPMKGFLQVSKKEFICSTFGASTPQEPVLPPPEHEGTAMLSLPTEVALRTFQRTEASSGKEVMASYQPQWL